MIHLMRKKFQDRRNSEEQSKDSPSSTPKCQSPADANEGPFAWPGKACPHGVNKSCDLCNNATEDKEENTDQYVGQLCDVCGKALHECCCNKAVHNADEQFVDVKPMKEAGNEPTSEFNRSKPQTTTSSTSTVQTDV